jgi:hypothetical protein
MNAVARFLGRPLAASALALSSLFVATSPAAAEGLSGKLLYVAIPPCRIAFTTHPSSSILTPGVPRTFNVVGNAGFSLQGGQAGGCGIPGFSGSAPQVQAVAVNLVAVNATGQGNLRAWPSDQPMPAASVINYGNIGTNLANSIILPVRQDVQGGDLTVQASFSPVHVLIDAVGYFTRARRRFYLTTNTVGVGVNGADVLDPGVCAAGFHVAAMSEILDPTVLQYDSALGATQLDAGSGVPYGAGWVRTGGPSAAEFGQAGLDNCAVWSSASAEHSGTTVALHADWNSSPGRIGPWTGILFACNTLHGVWCVED